ncbi:hypothetical protein PV761_03500 [Arthrobacter sp. CC3]|uniref:hypothetical protein n=1 Tax=Arthrobacter sp. CC3 TaxID=3029185 RepID=UPI003267A11E
MLDTRPLGGPLTTAEHRTARAHAQAHTFYRTDCPTRCESADRRAAHLLITPRTFLAAARIDPSLDTIAALLHVTRPVVDAYVRSLPVEDWLRMLALVGGEPS